MQLKYLMMICNLLTLNKCMNTLELHSLNIKEWSFYPLNINQIDGSFQQHSTRLDCSS